MNKKYIVPCTESQVVFSHIIMASPVTPGQVEEGNIDPNDPAMWGN